MMTRSPPRAISLPRWLLDQARSSSIGQRLAMRPVRHCDASGDIFAKRGLFGEDWSGTASEGDSSKRP